MSDTNHHMHKAIKNESQPVYKKWLTLSGIILIAIFTIFLGYKFIFQSPKGILAQGEWVKLSFPVSLFFMAFGIFFVVIAGDIAKNAWTKDSVEYIKWIRKRNRIKSENAGFFFISKSYSLWNGRIFSIVGMIMGLFITWAGAYSLWRNLFGG